MTAATKRDDMAKIAKEAGWRTLLSGTKRGAFFAAGMFGGRLVVGGDPVDAATLGALSLLAYASGTCLAIAGYLWWQRRSGYRSLSRWLP